MDNVSKIKQIEEEVVRWYNKLGRDLPWRNTNDPYSVLVSEVMLQQTQVDRVIPKFLEFLSVFPNLETLSRATIADVIKCWEGLGYNRRAVRLKRISEILVKGNYGEIPNEPDELKRLPGIGTYSANAIACFAYNKSVPLADTNIYRVLSRIVFGVTPPTRSEIDTLLNQALPFKSPSDFFQGLMDLAAAYCRVNSPKCSECFLLNTCGAGVEFLKETKLNPKNSVPYYPRQKKFKGSRRYYRGLIVKLLRKLGNDEQIGIIDLGEIMELETSDNSQQEWLLSILEELRNEGLIDISQGVHSIRVSLPSI